MKNEALHNNKKYDVIIIGAGASGASLLYTLAQFSNIPRIALLEKYNEPGMVNSKSSNNSQTLHIGDIETNYSITKAKEVNQAASMLVHYGRMVGEKESQKFLFPVQKMVLGVGKEEVDLLEKRFTELLPVFPTLAMAYREELSVLEPATVEGRDPDEPLVALHNRGHAVDYQMLAKSFVKQAKREGVETFFNAEVTDISHDSSGYTIHTKRGLFHARALVVNADSYSLFFAKKLGLGKEFSLIPVAGTFFFSPEILKGKVYTVQNPNLPFAAVHGDPDVQVAGQTRWGPTARIFPVLESRNIRTALDYFSSAGLLRIKTWTSFIRILSDPIKFFYLLKNGLYEIPLLGTWLFLQNIRKIVPSMQLSQITRAKGFGGMRLQRVDTSTGELKLGEGKIVGKNSIFNMTPSPGASVSLYNALRDGETVVDFFGKEFVFRKEEMERAFSCDTTLSERESTSISSSYVS